MNQLKKYLSPLVIGAIVFSSIPFVQAQNETPLSQTEKLQVQEAILDLQKHLGNSGKNFVEKLVSDFEKYTNYVENGNLSMELEANIEDAKFSTKIEMPNYEAVAVGLDSEISGDLNFSLDMEKNIFYPEDISAKLSTFFSFISKEGENYALLKNLNLDTNNPEIQAAFQQVQYFFKEEKYLKISDENSRQMMLMMQNFSPKNINPALEHLNTTALFEAYKKEGNTYFLTPTREFCNLFFEIQNTFGMYQKWYTPSSCTSQAYNSFVNTFKKYGDLTLTLWEVNNKLSYSFVEDDIKIEANLLYGKTSFGAVSLLVQDVKNPKNAFKLNYLKNKHLNISFTSVKEKINFSFLSKLANNTFVEIDSKISIPKVIQWAFTLKNKKIAGRYQIYQTSWQYDYENDSFSQTLKNIYGLQIVWNQNNVGNLEKLDIRFVWADSKTKDVFFNARTQYNTWNYNISLSGKTWNWKWNGKTSQKYFSLDSKYEGNLAWNKYSGNFDMIIDGENNKNNVSIFIDVNEADTFLWKFSLKNTAQQKRDGNREIKTPENVIDLNSLLYSWIEYNDEYNLDDLYE